MRYRVLSMRTIAVWALLIVSTGIGVAVWLLLAYTGGDTAANRLQLDAIRTAGTVVVGTGGAAALLLAARRQRSTEIALKQKDLDQVDVARTHALQKQVAEQTRQHQERVAAATEADAEARRITDLYTKAVEQLGSDKAPVRLGGLYALERLAQDHVEQRQMVVNVLCAYLRMPYTVPGDSPPASNPGTDNVALSEYRESLQEREVRLAAQRILAHHLLQGPDADNPFYSFWPHIDLDFTGATLIDVNFDHCTANNVRFERTTFIGDARFWRTIFTGNVWCNGASFTGDATFNACTFGGSTARFIDATFTGGAFFARATFIANTRFDRATFVERAWFNEATFAAQAIFHGATFSGPAQFTEVTFTGATSFGRTSFIEAADFRGVTLPSTRRFDNNTPPPWTEAMGARFDQGEPSEVAQFVAPPGEEADESGDSSTIEC